MYSVFCSLFRLIFIFYLFIQTFIFIGPSLFISILLAANGILWKFFILTTSLFRYLLSLSLKITIKILFSKLRQFIYCLTNSLFWDHNPVKPPSQKCHNWPHPVWPADYSPPTKNFWESAWHRQAKSASSGGEREGVQRTRPRDTESKISGKWTEYSFPLRNKNSELKLFVLIPQWVKQHSGTKELLLVLLLVLILSFISWLERVR